MDLCEILVDEYRKIDQVPFWSTGEKNAARSVLRGMAARSGILREFALTISKPDNVIVLKQAAKARSSIATIGAPPMRVSASKERN